MNESKIEILVLGKIGVGKSSFINNMLSLEKSDRMYAEVGEGRRTTVGIHRKESKVNGISVNLYDSMGLEASDESEKNKWLAILKYFFQGKGLAPHGISIDRPLSNIESNQSSDESYVHSCFYCIKGDVKLEEHDIDLKILGQIEKEYKQSVTVVLTNCDRATPEQVNALEKAIKSKYDIHILKTASPKTNTPTEGIKGNKIETASFGHNQFTCEMHIHFFDTLINWLPAEVTQDLRRGFEQACDNIRREIQKDITNNDKYIDWFKPLKTGGNELNNYFKAALNTVNFTQIIEDSFATHMQTWCGLLKDLEDIVGIDDFIKAMDEIENPEIDTAKIQATIGDVLGKLLKTGALGAAITGAIVTPELISTIVGLLAAAGMLLVTEFTKRSKMEEFLNDITYKYKESFTTKSGEIEEDLRKELNQAIGLFKEEIPEMREAATILDLQ